MPGPEAILTHPAFLKLDLFCRGLRLDPSVAAAARQAQAGRMRAGLGSGIELVLAGGIHVNAPVDEPFAAQSPYTLVRAEGQTRIRSGAQSVAVTLPDRPAFYDRLTSSGRRMDRLASVQGSVLSFYLGGVCRFWTMDPPRMCRFCATGLNVGVNEEGEKSVADVLETAVAAREELKLTFVHFNTGNHGGGETDALIPYIRAVKERTGMLVGVQCPPQSDPQSYVRLKRLGVDHLSFCLEFHNEEVLRSLCPGKAEHLGREAFYDAMAACCRLFPRGAVSGEIIAGIEPLADTLAAIDRITELGAFPTVCVFRPLSGTAMADQAPPAFEALYPVFSHAYRRLVERFIPVGLAPGIRVSIILTPAECRSFAPPLGWKGVAYHALLAAAKPLAGAFYTRRLRG